LVGWIRIDDLRLFYQPMLARLQLIEKHTLRGIQEADLEWVHDYLNEVIIKNKNEKGRKNLLLAEVYDKLGDLLYYKNIPFAPFEIDGPVKAPLAALRYYLDSLDNLKLYVKVGIEGEAVPEQEHEKASSLQGLLNASTELLVTYMHRMVKSSNHSVRVINYKHAIPKHALHSIGNALSDVGDSLFSSAGYEDVLDMKLLKLVLKMNPNLVKNKPEDGWQGQVSGSKSKITLAVMFYMAGGWYYRRAGEHREYSLQLTKVLYLVKDYLRIAKSPMTPGKELGLGCESLFLSLIERSIVKPAIRAIYRSYENTNESEFGYLQRFAAEPKSPDAPEELGDSYSPNTLLNISIAGEIKEILLSYEEIKLELNKEQLFNDTSIDLSTIAGPYGSIQNKFTRIIELNYKAQSHDYALRLIVNTCSKLKIGSLSELQDDELGKIVKGFLTEGEDLQSARKTSGFGQEMAGYDILIHLVTNAIYCLSESIRAQNIFGVSYIFNHSFLAFSHYYLAEWISLYESLINYERSSEGKEVLRKSSSRIEVELKKVIGKVEMHDLVKNAQYEKALRNFYQGIEMHTEGDAYLFVTNQMYYLDDDFNDNFFPFSAALERYRINTTYIPKMIDDIRRKIRDKESGDPHASYYDPSSYFPAKQQTN
jgi:hypothetical protein